MNARVVEQTIAERLVVKGTVEIAQQHSLIKALVREGGDTERAQARLAVLEEIQERLVADLGRLRKDGADT